MTTTDQPEKEPTVWVGPKLQPQLPLRYDEKFCVICNEPEGSLYAKPCCHDENLETR